MGCAQSRIDNEEAVSRCKDRKILMKEALVARNAFAAGHTGYAMSLKNTGAALSDYGHGEAENPENFNTHNDPMDPNSQPHMDAVLPPPPLPEFSPILLKRAVTMPEFSVSKPSLRNDSNTIMEDEDEMGAEDGGGGGSGDLRPRSRRNGVVEAEQEAAPLPPPSPPRTPPITAEPPPPPDSKGAWDYFFMPGPSFSELEEDIGDAKDEIRDEMFDAGKNVDVDEVEPKTPEKVVEKAAEKPGKKAKQIVHSNTAPPVPVEDIRRGSNVVSSVNLLKLLEAIDDHFLKASESAQEVTKMLEANRLHYHSNFADNTGHIDHSARVMRVITWNRSFRGLQNAEGGRDDFDPEDQETHASVLDKLVAWEKKLYDEVKAGELMKIEYQKKVVLLNKQKKRGASAESLEKTKAAVSHLHTRYIVDMQSMDSTVSEVNRLCDYQLYPKLVALVVGMAKMWESMCAHHDNQLKVATDLKSFDIAHSPKETSKHHHDQTIQLWNVIQEWHSQFDKLVTHQKQYVRALNSWLKLNLIPIESSLKEKISSPPKVQIPPIQTLLHSWNDHLEKLPDELAKTAISSFAAVIKTIIVHQEEEMRLKDKCEETNKEFMRKEQAFNEWLDKYRNRRTQSDETDPERGDGTNTKDPVSEKQFAVDSLRKRLEEEVEAHKKHCLQVREKSLGSLKTRLPELFRALSDYAHACSDAYEQLSSIAQSHNRNSAPS